MYVVIVNHFHSLAYSVICLCIWLVARSGVALGLRAYRPSDGREALNAAAVELLQEMWVLLQNGLLEEL